MWVVVICEAKAWTRGLFSNVRRGRCLQEEITVYRGLLEDFSSLGKSKVTYIFPWWPPVHPSLFSSYAIGLATSVNDQNVHGLKGPEILKWRKTASFSIQLSCELFHIWLWFISDPEIRNILQSFPQFRNNNTASCTFIILPYAFIVEPLRQMLLNVFSSVAYVKKHHAYLPSMDSLGSGLFCSHVVLIGGWTLSTEAFRGKVWLKACINLIIIQI